jgi:uncharacterized protein (TIGR00255 family)
MIKSMTGYGKSSVSIENRSITVEIRTLNSKQLDINLRLPQNLKEKEINIRKMISNALIRGKIDVGITLDNNSADEAPVIDKDMAKHYHKELLKLSDSLKIDSTSDFLELVVKMPDVFTQREKAINENDSLQFEKCIEKAVEAVDNSRIKEGADLEEDFKMRIDNILNLLEEVNNYDKNRIERIRNRIKGNIAKFANDPEMDQNRIEQEIIYYIEKIDITEEQVRLKNNCKYFLENLNNEKSSGKKLGFITQEIGREINTLGSKANDSDLQRIVVLMKDELEKIKEQLFNIL